MIQRGTKRSYTFGRMIKDIGILIQHLSKQIIQKKKTGAINGRFSEHLMLAVTAVNDCKYCSFIHSRLALQEGCSQVEVNDILNSNFQNVDKDEITALSFAQYYADTNGHPDRKSAKALLKCYGATTTEEILTRIYIIMIGNLAGNTIDAFEDYIKGYSKRIDSLLLGFIIYLIGKPITTFIR